VAKWNAALRKTDVAMVHYCPQVSALQRSKKENRKSGHFYFAGKRTFLFSVDSNNTGFFGRLAAYELLVVNENIRSHIKPGFAGNELRKLAVAEGMVTLTDNAIQLARQRVTSLSEVYRVCLEVL
jgi:type II secretory ATPase GspE/PulE/Tfp pilus assembly ATPase PilB-like protein